jgi:small multidrug resistance pump
MTWILLLVAIAAEVSGTLALRASVGFTRLGPSVVVVLGYVLAFVLLSLTLKRMAVGPAYAIWSGLGTVGAALGGWLLFSERLTPAAVGGIALIVAGVVVMNVGGGVTHG